MRRLGSALIVTLALNGLLVASELRIAAASSLQRVAHQLGEKFEAETGIQVGFSFASSGILAAQIERGAPFDLFLAADSEYPTQLAARGSALKDSLRIYAGGRLVIWTSSRQVGSPESVLKFTTGKIAIPNPALAPYGSAAIEILRHLRLEPMIRPRLVYGENAAQALHFATAGAAEAAITAASAVVCVPALPSGHYQWLPQGWHSPIQQGAVITRQAEKRNMIGTARLFLQWLLQDAAQRLLTDCGLVAVSALPAAEE